MSFQSSTLHIGIDPGLLEKWRREELEALDESMQPF